jgi:hypothetical protein
MWNLDSSPTITQSRLRNPCGDWVVIHDGGNATVANTQFEGVKLDVFEGSLKITHSKMSGRPPFPNIAVQAFSSGTLRVALSEVTGGLFKQSTAATLQCFNNYDENLHLIDTADCPQSTPSP